MATFNSYCVFCLCILPFLLFLRLTKFFFSLRMNVSEVDNLTPSTLFARRLKTVLVPLLGFLRLFGWLGEAFLALFFLHIAEVCL